MMRKKETYRTPQAGILFYETKIITTSGEAGDHGGSGESKGFGPGQELPDIDL